MTVSPKISACLVVHNEAAVIERCLQSVVGLAEEIIVVHDGPCSDSTLEIAKKYTNKIFVRPLVGIAEPHRVFSFEQASGEWIIQLDADEWLEKKDHDSIRLLTKAAAVDAYNFTWELWNGKKAIYFPGLQKICLFKKDTSTFVGVPQASVRGNVTQNVAIRLHHQPTYNNVAWRSFLRKAKRWIPIHARYFFYSASQIETFNCSADEWLKIANFEKTHPIRSIVWLPVRAFLGQMKNGLWRSRYGWQVGLQQYVCYVYLYWLVWRLTVSRNYEK